MHFGRSLCFAFLQELRYVFLFQVPPSVLMRYTPQSIPPTVQNTSVYPQAPQTQQIPCLCVPFLDSIAVNQVNMNCFPSQDITGKDLPGMFMDVMGCQGP